VPPSAPQPPTAGPRALSLPQHDATGSGHANATDEQLLALSDERDLWLWALHAAEREGFERGRTLGHDEGFAQAERDMAQRWQEVARPVARGGPAHGEIEAARWHVCCRPCRLGGHRRGCADCEDRTRETYGQPHPADSSGDMTDRARASWEPYGLPPPGLVHLGGRVVHHHICTPACDAYAPGWYTPQAAAAILETLPGDYAEAIASLLASAGTSGRRAA
jgi:hypothetical protein